MISQAKFKLLSDAAALFVPGKKNKDKVREKVCTAIWKYCNLRDAKHFFHDALTPSAHSTREEKLRILKNNLKLIAFECFSYCNRKCWFCPNAKLDRHSFNQYLPEETFLRMLDTLAEIDYDGNVSWTQYNEPLADIDVALKRIRQARERLPNAFFLLFTNSDFLTKELMYELDAAGINFLALQCYMNKDEPYDLDNNVKPRIGSMLKKLHIPLDETEEQVVFMSHYSRQLFLPTRKQNAGLCHVFQLTSRWDEPWRFHGRIRRSIQQKRTVQHAALQTTCCLYRPGHALLRVAA